MSDYVRGGGAPNLAALKLKKAAAKSVVTDIASSPAEPAPAPVEAAAAPAAAVEVPAPAVAPTPAPEPLQPVHAAVEPAPAPTPAPAETPAGVPAPAPEAPADPDDKLIKTSIRHKASKAKRLRATYIATMRIHRRRSLSDWLSDVLDAECTRLEELYNDGQPFDDDPEIPKGRPLSS